MKRKREYWEHSDLSVFISLSSFVCLPFSLSLFPTSAAEAVINFRTLFFPSLCLLSMPHPHPQSLWTLPLCPLLQIAVLLALFLLSYSRYLFPCTIRLRSKLLLFSELLKFFYLGCLVSFIVKARTF